MVKQYGELYQDTDDSMIEVGIAAVQAVLPEQEGQDRW